jgi:hypothetical protein
VCIYLVPRVSDRQTVLAASSALLASLYPWLGRSSGQSDDRTPLSERALVVLLSAAPVTVAASITAAGMLLCTLRLILFSLYCYEHEFLSCRTCFAPSILVLFV